MKNAQTVNALRRLAYVIEEEWARQGMEELLDVYHELEDTPFAAKWIPFGGSV